MLVNLLQTNAEGFPFFLFILTLLLVITLRCDTKHTL